MALNQKRVNGRPNYIRSELEKYLNRLNREYVDLYYLHRIDPDDQLKKVLVKCLDYLKKEKSNTLVCQKIHFQPFNELIKFIL